jgi:hypothetical protein
MVKLSVVLITSKASIMSRIMPFMQFNCADIPARARDRDKGLVDISTLVGASILALVAAI